MMTLKELISAQQIKAGDQVNILAIHGQSELSKRLFEIGFYKGVIIQYCGQAPFNGPFLFRIEMSVFALRENEIDLIDFKKSEQL